MVNPVATHPDAVAAGSNLYKNNCAQCHGADGNGRGSRPAFAPRASPAATDGDLFWILKNGSPSAACLPGPSCRRASAGRSSRICAASSRRQRPCERRKAVKLRHLALTSDRRGGVVARGDCGLRLAGELRSHARRRLTPPADSIGERIFLDTRFAEYFATHMTGVNDPLAAGDPVVATVDTTNGSLPGPFAGQAINCRSCHFVTEFQGVAGAGNRTYADFTTRSPIPATGRWAASTTRRATPCRWSTPSQRARARIFLHFDGEFATRQRPGVGTMTGAKLRLAARAVSTRPSRTSRRVIREDDGAASSPPTDSMGCPTHASFTGTDPRITTDLLLPASQRLDVPTATDDQVVNEVAMCMRQYMEDLLFQRDEYGRYIGSPYDNFLRVNHLPQAAAGRRDQACLQPAVATSKCSRSRIPSTSRTPDGSFKYHAQPYQFGATELQASRSSSPRRRNAADGNAACRQLRRLPPGAGLHRLRLPQHRRPRRRSTTACTATARLPHWPFPRWPSATRTSSSICRSARTIPTPARPSAAPPRQQSELRRSWPVERLSQSGYAESAGGTEGLCLRGGQGLLCRSGARGTIAQFKTPVLRDLADSQPYFHNGAALDLDAVIDQYINMSRAGTARARCGMRRRSSRTCRSRQQTRMRW